ncbi:GNAT family N-acetyltransferase [Micromonospora sp. BQ11]|uniref:GNAT family N-acetyltransferase n=1 Tax=Micromonospora sp. BQ11 TaxID=3452212 RepID=UPI003F8915A1
MDMTVVRSSPERSRYEILVGGTLVGFADYRLVDGDVVFTHTEIDVAHEGRGLGSRLIGEALDDVRRQGRSAVPLCSFVAAYIARHPEYADLVRRP